MEWGSEQKRHLIIAGNKKVDPFANTLRTVAKHWGANSIHSVYVTRFSSDKDLPDWRALSSEFFPKLVVYQEIAMEVPASYAKTFSDLLRDLMINRQISRDSIIVDLTNSTKTWCDVVYLVCTLMQIKQAFRLKLSHEYYALSYKEVEVDLLDLETEPIIDLEDLRIVVRSTYSEYMCYLKEVEQFIAWLEEESLLTLDSSKLYSGLLKGLEHHIRNDYEASIMKVATVLELFLDEMLRVLEAKFQTYWLFLTNNQPKPKFHSLGSKAQTLGQVCTRINYLISGSSNNITNTPDAQSLLKANETFQFAPLTALGFVLQSLGSIRNYSGHGNAHSSALQTEFDSQQMLNSVVYILGKTRSCQLLRK